MSSALCSPCHHLSPNYRRLRHPASPGHACPRSGTGGPPGLNTKAYLYFHPMSISMGSPVSYSSMDVSKSKQGPDHLLILVHGIMASPSDWTYGEAVLKRRLGDNFFIYASSSNIYTKTFDGIDVAGRRLANEVLDVIRKMASLRKISFLAHSLGGLFARYAISVLYSLETKDTGHRGARITPTTGGSEKSQRTSGLGVIAGLEPINFITLATPHLGVRGKNQPMADMVGWRTSSIRREIDLTKPLHRSLDGYKYIVNVEYCSPVSSKGPHFPSRAVRAKEAAQHTPNIENTEYHQMMEEEMIHGLQRVGWKKVDVSFRASLWPCSAHNNIHVKNEWLHNAGASVIAHVADSIKQTCFPANL